MKKIFTLGLLALSALSVQAQYEVRTLALNGYGTSQPIDNVSVLFPSENRTAQSYEPNTDKQVAETRAGADKTCNIEIFPEMPHYPQGKMSGDLIEGMTYSQENFGGTPEIVGVWDTGQSALITLSNIPSNTVIKGIDAAIEPDCIEGKCDITAYIGEKEIAALRACGEKVNYGIEVIEQTVLPMEMKVSNPTVDTSEMKIKIESLKGGTAVYYFNLHYTTVTDGIETLHTKAIENNAIYDLQGRRVKNPQHGIYIVNGKKVIL